MRQKCAEQTCTEAERGHNSKTEGKDGKWLLHLLAKRFPVSKIATGGNVSYSKPRMLTYRDTSVCRRRSSMCTVTSTRRTQNAGGTGSMMKETGS